MTLHLNLGSNIGDRRALLSRAARQVVALLPGVWKVSAPVESAPWGFDSENRFLNIAMAGELRSPLPPEDILTTLQEIERSLGSGPHRDLHGAYIDRLIDIDIISIDSPAPLHIATPRLTLPHPRATERPFVINPLSTLAPSHPLLKQDYSTSNPQIHIEFSDYNPQIRYKFGD